MKKLKLMTVCCLLLLCSCNKSNMTIFNHFKEYTELKGPEVVVKNAINSPNRIVMFDSLIVASSAIDEPYLAMYKIGASGEKRWLNMGRSGDELLNFTNMCKYRDSLIYVDGDPNTILLYNINDVVKGITKPHRHIKYTNTAFNNTIMVDSNTLVYQAKNLSDKGECSRFCTEDIDSNELSYWGEYPENDYAIRDIPNTDYSRLTTYQGKMTNSNRYNKSIAYYLYAVGFDIIDNSKQKIEYSHFYQYPDVEVISAMNANFIKQSENSKRGFIDAYCDDDAIYFLYSDKLFSEEKTSYGKYILKYSWKGDPLYYWILDNEISCFTISDDGLFLYGAIEQEYNSVIAKYSLSFN